MLGCAEAHRRRAEDVVIVLDALNARNETVSGQILAGDDGLTVDVTVNAPVSGTVTGTVFAGDGVTSVSSIYVEAFDTAGNYALATTYTDAAGVTAPVVCCSGQSMGYAGNDGMDDAAALAPDVLWATESSDNLNVESPFGKPRPRLLRRLPSR